MRQFWVAPEWLLWALVPTKTEPRIEAWTCQPLTSLSWTHFLIRKPLILLLSPWFCLFPSNIELESYRMYVAFSDRLLSSVTDVHLRFLHVSSQPDGSFLFKVESYSTVWMPLQLVYPLTWRMESLITEASGNGGWLLHGGLSPDVRP